jgi:hypothetical protein
MKRLLQMKLHLMMKKLKQPSDRNVEDDGQGERLLLLVVLSGVRRLRKAMKAPQKRATALLLLYQKIMLDPLGAKA